MMIACLRKKVWLAALLLGLLAGLLAQTPRASSQTGGAYDLSWNTVDGGGITFAQGGVYSLGGTIGAADAGVQSGGQYSLGGGFWSGTSDKRNVYLPALRR
jgi:hypothetical protein